MQNIVIGTVGTVLDQRGKRGNRWGSWRPSVGLCLHDELPIHKFELIYQTAHERLAMQLFADITLASPKTVVELHCIEIDDPWDFQAAYTGLYEFAKGYHFDTEKANYYVHITTGTHVMQICWFLLTESHYLPAKLIQTAPPKKIKSNEQAAVNPSGTKAEVIFEQEAQDDLQSQTSHLPKTGKIQALPDDRHLLPCGTYTIIDLDLSRYDEIARRHSLEREAHYEQLKSGIATLNPHYNLMITEIEKVATVSKSPILLNGPTGSGKSFLAKRIYDLKLNKYQLTGEFVEINCATLRGDGAMSTLFGHVKGAFTGALNERSGLLKKADKGLLFLDEIGELGLDEQAMLLKAIEEKVFYPLGSDKEVVSDFQLIAGTHRDLRQWVQQGRFREDLYARINLWSYTLPGLAERLEDIAPNIEYELDQFFRLNQKQITFNREAKAKYLAFATSKVALWRGNFRELSSSITRLATLALGGRIDESLVDDEINRLKRAWQIEDHDVKRVGDPASKLSTSLETLLAKWDLCLDDIDLFEQQQLLTVIEICLASRNLSEAGRALFAVSRQNKKASNDADRLRKYLAKFGLTFELLHD